MKCWPGKTVNTYHQGRGEVKVNTAHITDIYYLDGGKCNYPSILPGHGSLSIIAQPLATFEKPASLLAYNDLLLAFDDAATTVSARCL